MRAEKPPESLTALENCAKSSKRKRCNNDNNDNDNRIYEIETLKSKIIDKNNKVFYKVKWLNFNNRQNRWEPFENIPEHMAQSYNEPCKNYN